MKNSIVHERIPQGLGVQILSIIFSVIISLPAQEGTQKTIKEIALDVAGRDGSALVKAFDSFYDNQLTPLSDWSDWITLTEKLSKLGTSAFAGAVNLHLHTDLMERFFKVYNQMKEEYSQKSTREIDWIKEIKNRIEMNYTIRDSPFVSKVTEILEEGHSSIEAFFQQPFKKAVKVFLFPDREALDKQWQVDWNLPDFQSECWMIGSGVAHRLDFLSPRVWKTQACEHDSDDEVEIRQLLTHELVHVYHCQYLPTTNFEELEEIGWFLEGIAVYLAGQLDSSRMTDLINWVKKEKVQIRLKDAWSGPHRYGIAGSMVKMIDEKYGRDVLTDLLSAVDQSQILRKLDQSENAFLNEWKVFLIMDKQ